MIIASTSLLAEPSSDANAPRTTAFGLADQGGMESLDDPKQK
jgi:hypothetical protein